MQKLQKFTKQRRIHLSYTSIIADLNIVVYLEIDFNYSFWLLEASLQAYVCVTISAIFFLQSRYFCSWKGFTKIYKTQMTSWLLLHLEYWTFWFFFELFCLLKLVIQYELNPPVIKNKNLQIRRTMKIMLPKFTSLKMLVLSFYYSFPRTTRVKWYLIVD